MQSTSRLNYEIAKLSGYAVNKWYWIYASRAQSGLLATTQIVGIYDPQNDSFLVNKNDDWNQTYIIANLSAPTLAIYANGFKGFAQGFCGHLRGLAVMKGASLDLHSAYEYLAQRQSGGSLSSLKLFMPFDAETGPYAKDGSPNKYDGIFGSSVSVDSNDPVWEKVTFAFLKSFCTVKLLLLESKSWIALHGWRAA